MPVQLYLQKVDQQGHGQNVMVVWPATIPSTNCLFVATIIQLMASLTLEIL